MRRIIAGVFALALGATQALAAPSYGMPNPPRTPDAMETRMPEFNWSGPRVHAWREWGDLLALMQTAKHWMEARKLVTDKYGELPIFFKECANPGEAPCKHAIIVTGVGGDDEGDTYASPKAVIRFDVARPLQFGGINKMLWVDLYGGR